METRRNICYNCKCRLTKMVDGKVVWLGHYTIATMFCVDCWEKIYGKKL